MSTIKDVAKYANVSIGTVSKYINGIPVREKNRKNIEEAIRVLDYRINATARSLKTQRSNLVAVLMDNLAGYYYPWVVQEAEKFFYQKGYNIIVMSSHGDSHLEKQKIEIMLEKNVDGFLVFPLSDSYENYEYLLDKHIPLVLVDLGIPDLHCNQVLTDNVGALFHATASLIAQGHRRIGIITGNIGNSTAFERLNGYKMAFESFGLSWSEDDIQALGFSVADGFEGTKRLLERPVPPTALITCNYHTTAGCAKYIMTNHIIIPDQLNWIGFDYDEVPLLTQWPIPIITQDISRIAKTAVECLLDSIEHPDNAQYATYRIETKPLYVSGAAII